MTRRTTTRLAFSLAVLAAAATGAELWLLMVSPEGLPIADPDRAAMVDYVEWVFALIVGTLVAWKRPENRVGWFLLVYAVSGAVIGFMFAYSERGVLTDPGSLPGAGASAWLVGWLWVAHFLLVPLILLHFPTGRLPSPRWRWAAWCCALPAVMMGVAAIGLRDVPARVLLRSIDESLPVAEWTRTLTNSALAVLLGLVLSSIVSLFVRYRRAGVEERQQLKWVLFAAALFFAGGVWESVPLGSRDVKAIASALAFAAIPASMGVAILKYRLYDIDRIINRTLVYGLLTATLGVCYLLLVLALQRLLDPLTQSNQIAIAASTLLVAALFQPARGRIQAFINRRFYRSRYDAAQTLERFSTRIREGIDLEVLTSDLLAVVGRTVQPAHISLWLRPGADGHMVAPSPQPAVAMTKEE